MKLLILLVFILSLVSCEQQDIVDAAQNGGVVEINEVSSDYYGTYDLGCRYIDYVVGNQAQLTLILAETGSKMIEEVYVSGGAPCSNPANKIFTLEHDLDMYAEYSVALDAEGNPLPAEIEMDIEFTNSELEVHHTVMNGYVCGDITVSGTGSYDVAGKGCGVDKVGEKYTYEVRSVSGNDVDWVEITGINMKNIVMIDFIMSL